MYDGRESTKEYVPLGYWDGERNPLSEGLIGRYTFSEKKSHVYNEACPYDLEAVAKQLKDDGSEHIENMNLDNDYQTGWKGWGLKLYSNSGTKQVDNFMLDAIPSDYSNFTVSFAVKAANNSQSAITGDQGILYIGDSSMDRTKSYYEIYRGEQGTAVDKARNVQLGYWDGNQKNIQKWEQLHSLMIQIGIRLPVL